MSGRIRPKKSLIDSQALFEKNRCGRQVFYFYFLFPQKEMREAGFFFLFFYFLKNRLGMYLHELLYSPTMFHGRCTMAPDDI